ncbi:His Kinase A domain containing protein [Mortierella sp. GBA30]|nr:His Kinase A domain containing protein [Mortierella sp. GBA30]
MDSSTEDVHPLDQGEAPSRSSIFQQPRPRFLRAITSPIPTLGALALLPTMDSSATTPDPSTSTSHGGEHNTSSRDLTARNTTQEISGKPVRPRPQPLQLDPDQHHHPLASLQDTAMRVFSSSLLSPFLPSTPGSILSMPTSPISSTHSQNSIAETLKERRWSKAQTLNWMPGFSSGHFADGYESHPSPVTASSTSSRSLKSAHRRRSEVPRRQFATCDRDSDQYDGCASLGLDFVSVAGNLCNGLASGQNTPPTRDQGFGLTERLSAFTQGMRNRPSLGGENMSPPTSVSSASTPSASLPESRTDISVQLPHMSYSGSVCNGGFESWDDFLNYYRQGLFPSDKVPPRPLLESKYPPFHHYAEYVNRSDSPQFLAPPTPAEEEKRLRALYRFRILEASSDTNFQRIAQLVATVLDVDGCMICLVDHDRVAVKAQSNAPIMGCSREESIGGHAILKGPNDPLVILDASQDWRFKNLPTVAAGPQVRFYAAASLTTADGFNIGCLCVVDPKPRSVFSEKEKMLLVDFATVVMREMELWNDQVELCTRTRMMRDITFWVRGCLGISDNDSTNSVPPQSFSSRRSCKEASECQPTCPTSTVVDGTAHAACAVTTPMVPGSASSDPIMPPYNTPPPDAALPTPSGSPTLLSGRLASGAHATAPRRQKDTDQLHDKAFPSACSMIRMTLNVDAVYLVQASASQSFMPLAGSDVVWNYLGPEARKRVSVGTAGDGRTLPTPTGLALSCLASSKKMAGLEERSIFDQSTQHSRREGDSWICTDEGCRPHRLGDVLLDAVEPEWERDLPIITEMVKYVRQEIQPPEGTSSQTPLYTCCQRSDEKDWFGLSTNPASQDNNIRQNHLCHTFQGTLPELAAGATTPYKSCIVMPVHGASASDLSPKDDAEPWAYFVVLSSSHTKQFSLHERIYLKNFGSCLITEVLKRRVEAADKAKGVFIKSISHELRTPLHIILGILELLNANTEGNLSDHQLSMIASAEASGRSLIDTINNIIDLADLDPDNNIDSKRYERGKGSLADLYTQVSEIDIRDLCEQVAGSMAKACNEKNLVILPSWTKPTLTPLSSTVASSMPTSALGTGITGTAPVQCYSGNRSSMDESVNGEFSSADSSGISASMFRSERKASLELLVAMDEPDRDPEQDAHWNFMLNLPVIKRILTQLLENALKFTTTGFVEISAVSPPLGSFPLKPPQPDSRPILFTVRDTGRGISPEFVQAHLFQRFSQEDPLQAGTGLGLALVKLLVESLGGWLEIWSEGIEGKGCVVRVLIWATPSAKTTKSLKDEPGAWQEKSCRFYAGESTVSTDRLWKIVGERMLGQDLSMNVERGNEQDVSPEDMLRDLSDQSRCDLLVFNDDLSRLKAYLSHWSDRHADKETLTAGDRAPINPTPLLMLTSIPNEKKARNLVAAYRTSWAGSGSSQKRLHPAAVVILPKPVGPLRLLNCLRECFDETPAGENSTSLEISQPTPIPLLRSSTLPHITTMALGVHDNRNFSAGTVIRSSFKFPASAGAAMRSGRTTAPPHSPGGLNLPTQNSTTTAEPAVDKGEDCQGASRDSFESKPRPQRTIRNFVAQRNGVPLRSSSRKKASTQTATTPTAQTDSSGQGAVGCCTDAAGKPVPEALDQLGQLEPVPRVLIVEDNMTNRMILKTFLKKRGVPVVEAENGKLGVERFQEEVWRRQGRSGFEFVLMDLQMPIMDGNLATKRIREFEQTMVKQHGLSNPEPSCVEKMRSGQGQEEGESEGRGYRRTMIFALTGLAGEEDKRLAFECGVDGYLTKPVSLKNLGALLSSCHPSVVAGRRCPEAVAIVGAVQTS